jgi:hypothetical protein
MASENKKMFDPAFCPKCQDVPKKGARVVIEDYGGNSICSSCKVEWHKCNETIRYNSVGPRYCEYCKISRSTNLYNRAGFY